MFESFPKIPRLNREIVITEKIDGTNAQIHIEHALNVQCSGAFVLGQMDDLVMLAGSRNRYITLWSDNFGFAKFVQDNAEELFKLGPGRHYGEWWGKGIQRGYGLDEKRFSLFNTRRWGDGVYGEKPPECCHVVPVLGMGEFGCGVTITGMLKTLKKHGSVAAPGFMDPEGIMVYHTAANQYFKVTCRDDEKPKSS